MEHTEEIKSFIRDREELFWYVRSDAKEHISVEYLIETILNYGTLNDVKAMIELLGIRTIADIFFQQSTRQRHNYFPRVKQFFTLYFRRHA